MRDRLVVVGADDGVNDPGLVKVLRAFDPGDVADQHAIVHDQGFKAGRAVAVPLGFAPAGQRQPDTELAVAPTEQVSVDATVAKRIDHAAGSELIHVLDGNVRSWRISESSLEAHAV